MARLTAAKRHSHARNALARVSQFGSPALKAKVQAKVHSKYPDMGKDTGGRCSRRNRKVGGKVDGEKPKHRMDRKH